MKLDYTKYPDVPPGYSLNENRKAGLYQVYRDIWKEDPATGTKRIFRETIGSIRDGKFHPSETYQLRKELDRVRKDNEDLRSRLALLPESSEETGRQAGQVRAHVCQSIEKSRLDTRGQDPVRVPMSSIMLSSVMCSLGGGTDASAISDWAKTHRNFFERCLPGEKVENITHDVVQRALMVVDPGKFDVFCTDMTVPLIRLAAGRIAAAGGQAIRATGRRSREDSAMHGAKMLFSVYDTGDRVCLSHQLIDKKANEISVGFKMIEKLSLPGSIVTADAMNCQARFAEAVLNAQADYLLSLKGSQDRSWQEVIALFAETGDSQVKKYRDDIELAHGRIESREIAILPGRLMSAPMTRKWPGLAGGSIVSERVVCTYRSTGRESKPRKGTSLHRYRRTRNTLKGFTKRSAPIGGSGTACIACLTFTGGRTGCLPRASVTSPVGAHWASWHWPSLKTTGTGCGTQAGARVMNPSLSGRCRPGVENLRGPSSVWRQGWASSSLNFS